MSLKQQLQEAARKVSSRDTTDMSAEATQRPRWPNNIYRGRVCEVIELGRQDQGEYQNVKKRPAEEVRLGIMLFPNAVVKNLLGEDAGPLIVRPWPLAIYNSDKAKAKKAFNKMNLTNDAKHFREFIGEAYRFKLETRTNKKGTEYYTIDLESTLPAVNEETGKPLNVPEVPEDQLTLFTFVNPLPEMWERLYIEGTSDDGKSKNFIQEKIMSALNYSGSDVERLVKGNKGSDIAKTVKAAQKSTEDLPEPPVDDFDDFDTE